MSFLCAVCFFLELCIVRLTSSDCYVGQLPTEDDLWYSLNSNGTLVPESPARTFLYPNATFNCSGYISSATYLALNINPARNGKPLLEVYNNTNDGTYKVVGFSTLDVNYTVASMANSSILLQVDHFYPPIAFKTGNAVGVHLPQASVEKYRLLFYDTGTINPAPYGLYVSMIAAPTVFTISRSLQKTVVPALYLDLCTEGDPRYPDCTVAVTRTVATSSSSSESSLMAILPTITLTPTVIGTLVPVPASVQPLPLATILGSIGGFTVAALVILAAIATAFCIFAKHQSTLLERDETMMDNALYSCVHRDTLQKSSVIPNASNGTHPPLPEMQPSPYMQPETTMSQSDPPPLPPPFQYEIPQNLDPKKHVYLSLDKEDAADYSTGIDGTPQSGTAFLTPCESPVPTKLRATPYNVLQRIGSKHEFETKETLSRSTRLSSANSVFDDCKYNILHQVDEEKPTTTASPQAVEDPNPYWKPSHNIGELCGQLSKMMYRNILKADLQFTGHLGSGEFGTVQKGVWKHGGHTQEVAIKSLNSNATTEDKVRFLREAAIMGQFTHPHIIRLHGVITEGDPIMIVLELAHAGDLRKYLKSIRPVPGELLPSTIPKMFVRFGCEIALGMEYLARKEFVHRDLAARNVLLTENRVCKIADFGLSRDLEDENCYIARSGAKIPIKWTAPEAINFKRYSTSSDVWSYGVVLFEIWSLGHTPFNHLSIEDTIKAVDAGKRMPPPPGCPKAIYQLMMECWHPDASMRPNFTNIVETMTALDGSNIGNCWAAEERVENSQALVIGSSLHCAENLYSDLQHIYERIRTQTI